MNRPIPENVDEEKLSEIALALLWLGIHGDKDYPRAWKGLDWDVMNLLHEKGYIANPVGKAKSVHLLLGTPDKAEALFKKHFSSDG